jgi:Mn2+/Fe2+ NRAMP family transporter
MILIALTFTFGSVLLKQSPPSLMVFSMAFQACILPAVAIPAIILLNRKKLMGSHKAGIAENLGVVAVILFSFLTTWYALVDLL